LTQKETQRCIVELAGTSRPPEFLPMYRLFHATWAGNPANSHKKHKLPLCVFRDPATVW